MTSNSYLQKLTSTCQKETSASRVITACMYCCTYWINLEIYLLVVLLIGAVVRALAFHQCGPGSIPRIVRHMWVEFVGSLICSERFFPGYIWDISKVIIIIIIIIIIINYYWIRSPAAREFSKCFVSLYLIDSFPCNKLKLLLLASFPLSFPRKLLPFFST